MTYEFIWIGDKNEDLAKFSFLAENFNYEIKTIKAAIEVNEHQKLKLFKKSRKYYESLNGLTVAVLGLTFKPGTDDLREAPSLVNVPMMLDDGAIVHAWDPVGKQNFQRAMERYNEYDLSRIVYFETPQEAVKHADICFVFTEWPEVKAMQPEDFLQMKQPVVMDGRNCFSVKQMKKNRINYVSIGRNTIEIY
jgi:UDPglucose 6-dehydrogenase